MGIPAQPPWKATQVVLPTLLKANPSFSSTEGAGLQVLINALPSYNFLSLSWFCPRSYVGSFQLKGGSRFIGRVDLFNSGTSLGKKNSN